MSEEDLKRNEIQWKRIYSDRNTKHLKPSSLLNNSVIVHCFLEDDTYERAYIVLHTFTYGFELGLDVLLADVMFKNRNVFSFVIFH